ncbi:MAG TPA: transglutaminase family protein [Syntrophomonadaceae bacterium]|nr:transglutaminase family protein [Syntrophomonadaceae bacterium]
MLIFPEIENLDLYLESSEMIDFFEPNIQKIAQQIGADSSHEIPLVRSCYEWVRDTIRHSFDGSGVIVTCRASEVLLYQEGICYAKSHLLAALLRYWRIPAGFCYQRLVLDDLDPSRLVIHGLNAVFLRSLNRWIRLDARGNKEGVYAEFCTEREILAFPVRNELGESEDPVIYRNPHPKITAALIRSKTLEELVLNLPDHL